MGTSTILRIILAFLVITCLPLSSSHGQLLVKGWSISEDDVQKWKNRIIKLCPPDGWTVAAHGNEIIIQRDKPVRFGSNSHLINAGWEDKPLQAPLREGTYRLVLRFAPHMRQDTYEKLAQQNDATEDADLELRRKYKLDSKFGIIRSHTEDEKKREQAYREEAKKLIWHRLPHLYSADYSVYFYHSWNWLEFLDRSDKKIHEECEDVWQGIEKLFGVFDPNVARGGGSLGQTEPNAEQLAGLQNIIIYRSPFEEVEIKGLQLTYKRHTYQYESRVSGNPVGKQTGTRVVTVTPGGVEKLLAIIQTANFYDLQDIYGAPNGHRYYGYEVHVAEKSSFKNVTYRSNPEFAAPKEFHIVEKSILDFAKESMKGKP